MRSDAARLRDMLEAIERLERYATHGEEVFRNDELVQTWVVHHLQIIGEAASALSASFCTRHSQVPWAQIVAMRNILVHEYFGIDLNEVWQTVVRDLPDLKQKISHLIEKEEGDGPTSGPAE